MSSIPRHLSIIMDGNGRWAKARGHNRFFGHIRGAKAAKRIIEECSRLGIENLTLFTFSTENWKRPKEEVSFLMSLLVRRLRRERASLIKNNIRFQCIGDLASLPLSVVNEVQTTIDQTAHCTGLRLVFALSYGGRQEIAQCFSRISEDIEAGKISKNDVSEALISQYMPSSFLPDPDLIIRTSGESRISNFFLWQAAYSEIYVCEKMWPDFKEKDLHLALSSFAKKERRFGKTSDQVRVLEFLPSLQVRS